MPPHHWNPNMNWSAPGGPPQAHQPMRAPPASTSQTHTGRWRCSMFLFLASNTTTISLLSPCSSVNLLLLSSLELSNSRTLAAVSVDVSVPRPPPSQVNSFPAQHTVPPGSTAATRAAAQPRPARLIFNEELSMVGYMFVFSSCVFSSLFLFFSSFARSLGGLTLKTPSRAGGEARSPRQVPLRRSRSEGAGRQPRCCHREQATEYSRWQVTDSVALPFCQ
jgi:hypothetical protein